MNKEQKQIFYKEKIRAIIGLGNPGHRFIKTRHNIGFRIVEHCAERAGAASWRAQENLEYATIAGAHQQIFLIKPLTFMNESGRVVSFLQKKGIKADEIVVVHDELEKKFGSLLLSFGGSPRGHNGIKSLQAQLGPSFWRLRVGIDRPIEHDPEAVGAYVLGNFTTQEEALLLAVFNQAEQLLIE